MQQLTGNNRLVPPEGRFQEQVVPSRGSIFLCTIKISPNDLVLTRSKTVRITKYSVVPPSDTKYSVQLPKIRVFVRPQQLWRRCGSGVGAVIAAELAQGLQ
jgi:hypothetical protein